MPPERREIPAATIRALEQHLSARLEGTVDFSTGARALYATDSSNYRQVPVGVVFPRTAEDVVETVGACREHRIPILPRGGGTSLAGQCCNVAVVIDLSVTSTPSSMSIPIARSRASSQGSSSTTCSAPLVSTG